MIKAKPDKYFGKGAQEYKLIQTPDEVANDVEQKMKILANFLIDRILEDAKNGKLKLAIK
jgi:hypothetical protein